MIQAGRSVQKANFHSWCVHFFYYSALQHLIEYEADLITQHMQLLVSIVTPCENLSVKEDIKFLYRNKETFSDME